MSVMDRYDRFLHITFAEAAQQYLDEFDGKCKDRQEYALAPIIETVGHLPLIDVDDLALQPYKEKRRETAMAGTINKELTTATAVLNKAARVWRYIPSAPKLQHVNGPTRKPYPITWAEQGRWFPLLKFELLQICLFAVNTGVRRAEVFKLKWTDERVVRGVRLFILRDTKNGHDRPVILNSIARRVVDMRPRDRDFVFRRQSVSKPLNRTWVQAGLPDDPLTKKGIHNLRHTFGYRLRNEGVGPEDRDALLGHHNRSLTQHYALPAIERLGELVELITKPNDVAVLR